jgi:hypothetical protein
MYYYITKRAEGRKDCNCSNFFTALVCDKLTLQGYTINVSELGSLCNYLSYLSLAATIYYCVLFYTALTVLRAYSVGGTMAGEG